jgi:hypothetical protein
MPHCEHLEIIRTLVRSAFRELGANEDAQLREKILIREDLYCGRRFQCNDLQAVWFIEEDEIKIYGSDGAVVKVLNDPHPISKDKQSLQDAA